MTKQFIDLTPKPAERIEELTLAVENIERGQIVLLNNQMVVLSKLDTVILMLEQVLQRNKMTH